MKITLNKKALDFLSEVGLIITVIIGLSIVLATISKSCNPTASVETSTIDSLQKANDSLRIAKDSLDSVRVIYLKEIDSLSTVIDTIESKVKIVKVYYTKKGGEVSKYTPGQLDTFFKIRYNY